jgi:hypothetical protein
MVHQHSLDILDLTCIPSQLLSVQRALNSFCGRIPRYTWVDDNSALPPVDSPRVASLLLLQPVTTSFSVLGVSLNTVRRSTIEHCVTQRETLVLQMLSKQFM